MALQVILCLILFTVPEQIDAQGQLLERRTQAGVTVPALLHDLVDLRDKAGRQSFQHGDKNNSLIKYYCTSLIIVTPPHQQQQKSKMK